MNKYQEAVDTLRTAPMRFDQDLYDDHKEEIDLLQELVNKATPKKTIKEPIIKNGYRQYKNYCPICKQELLILGNYCLHCGQAVDWSDNNE